MTRTTNHANSDNADTLLAPTESSAGLAGAGSLSSYRSITAGLSLPSSHREYDRHEDCREG